ncbi:MAG: hypothetical protein ABI383_09030 [Acidobacteriaceae bacterium]
MCFMTAALIAAGAGSAGGLAAFAVKKFRAEKTLHKSVPTGRSNNSELARLSEFRIPGELDSAADLEC